MKFCKELYSKVALIKAAYNFTDNAYVHLDADDNYYYVAIEPKHKSFEVSEQEFINELLLARAMATSVVVDEKLVDDPETGDTFSENEILKDWFAANEENKN